MRPEDYRRAARHLARRDPVLALVIDCIGPCRLAREEDENFFDGLVRTITGQQLSTKAASTIFARVVGLAGGSRPIQPAALLAVTHDALRGAGLSDRKATYVHDLAARVASGSLDLAALRALDDEAVARVLTGIRGIGRWSAEMFLIFRLQRPDVLPLDDVGILRAAHRLYGLRRRPSEARLTRLAEPWRPYRSIACWYLWASLTLPLESLRA